MGRDFEGLLVQQLCLVVEALKAQDLLLLFLCLRVVDKEVPLEDLSRKVFRWLWWRDDVVAPTTLKQRRRGPRLVAGLPFPTSHLHTPLIVWRCLRPTARRVWTEHAACQIPSSLNDKRFGPLKMA